MRLSLTLYYSCLLSLFAAGSIQAEAQPDPVPNVPPMPREPEETRTYRIAAADASESLAAFARQAGTAIVFVVEQVRGVRTNAIEGKYRTREALDLLLAHTALVVAEDSRTGALMVKRAPPARPKKSASEPETPVPLTRPMPSSSSRTRAGILPALLSLFIVPSAPGQPDTTKANTTDVVQMMTYRVSGAADSGYYSANALTGTRTQTPLAELPMTVNVVTSELIADIGAVKLEESLLYTSGVRKGSDFESNFTLRGFLNETPRFNGISVRNTSRWDNAVIDRVEVLKGPSAALNGSTGTAGGFVNVISKKPLFRTQSELSLTASSEDRQRAAFDTTGPLAFGGSPAKLAYRLIGVVQEGSNNGWRDFSKGHRTILSPSLTWRPTQRTEVTVELYRDRYNRTMDQASVPVRGNDQSHIYFDQVPRTFNINGPDSFDNYWMNGAFVYVTSQLSTDWTVRLVSAWFRSDDNFLRRQGFTERPNTPGVLATFGLNRNPTLDSVWHRLDAQWKRTFRTGKLTLLLGVQHQNETQGNTNVQDTSEPPFPLFAYTAQNFAYKPLSGFVRRLHADTDTRGWLLNGILSYGLFADRLTLFGGYSHLTHGEGRFIDYNAGQTPSTAPWSRVDDPDDYQFGATVKVTPKINVYGLYSRDIRLNAFDNFGVRLPNQTQDMLEAGVKFNLGAKLNGSIACFTITRNNLAQRDTSQPSQPITPSGEERSRGFEVELYATPLPNLDVIFGFTHLDAKIVSNKERPDLVGTWLPESPRDSASSWARYKFAQGKLKGLSLGLGLVLSAESHPFGTDTTQRRAFATAPAYALVNVMARYSFTVGRANEMSAQLSLNNLTDEKYMSGADFGPPRLADLRVSLRF